jgi:hypothetical protein
MFKDSAFFTEQKEKPTVHMHLRKTGHGMNIGAL